MFESGQEIEIVSLSVVCVQDTDFWGGLQEGGGGVSAGRCSGSLATYCVECSTTCALSVILSRFMVEN